MLRLLTHRASLHTSKYNWQPGDRFLSFQLLSTSPLSDHNSHLHHLKHLPTNSQIIHIEKADPNNCFAPIVQTLANNNKGAPHILEHLACCGSEKFPVRDPFFNMLKRSLNTYMNAWTGSDFTCYPFSTGNRKDFGNLMRVYLDMVFRPRLDYLDFRQQGWRYELDPNNKPIYKGIVLNEMLGAYQTPDRKLWKQLTTNLLAGTPYEYDTGGYPPEIVNLEYEELVQMHKKFYSPRNVKFFSYGDGDVKGVLQYLEENYLGKQSAGVKVDQKEKVNFIPKLKKREVTISSNSPENQIVFSLYLGEIDKVDKRDLWALQLLNYLLFETSQAIFYQQLIQKQIGTTFSGSQGTSFDKLLTFSIGLKGIKPTLSHKTFKSIIFSTLQKVKHQGFSPDRIDEVIHQVTISNAMPVSNEGLKLLERLLTPINHGCDVKEQLQFREVLEELRGLMKDREFVAGLIQKYLMKGEDGHHVCVVQLGKEEKVVVGKEQQVQQKQPQQQQQGQFQLQPPQSLTTNHPLKSQILTQQQNLSTRQDSKSDSSILPTLALSDIQPHMPKYKIEKKQIQGHKISFITTSESGITHFRAIFRFEKHQLPETILNALELWSYALNKGISTERRTYKQLAREFSLCSAGLQVAFDYDPMTLETLIIFKIAALDNNVERSLQLLTEVITTPKFQPDNIKDIFKAFNTDAINDIIENPMAYARSAAAAGVSQVQNLKEKFRINEKGRELVEMYEKGDRRVMGVFEEIHGRLLCGRVEFVVHGSKEGMIDMPGILIKSLNPSTATTVNTQNTHSFTPSPTYKFYPNDLHNVDCCSSAFPGPAPFTTASAHISVFLELLQQTYLHKQVRQKGGAYGSSAKYLSSGVVVLGSYLDPSSLRTLKVFTQSIEKLINSEITEQQLTEAKLSLFSRLDSPVVEYERGMREVLFGQGYEVLDEWRSVCRETTVQQAKEAARRYLGGKGSSATVGPMDKEKQQLAEAAYKPS